MDLPALQHRFSPLLAPVACLYGAAMRVRARAWLGSSARLVCACPCVSVGNIAWGGTGKTPLVEWLMHWAAKEGLRAVVLSRGYGAAIQNPPTRVRPDHDPGQVGDEPLMLSLSCPAVPVLVDPARRRAAAFAMRTLRPQLLILDDGFQHLALHRDLDLVLLRPEDLFDQWNRVIPAGSWREPVSALERAGAFLIKCTPETMAELAPALRRRLEPFGKPVFSFSLEATGLRRIDGQDTATSPEQDRRAYTLVTGVGSPEQVRNTVAGHMGYEPEEFYARPDHHRFTRDEVRSLTSGGRTVIVTAKDAVKLRMFPAPDFWYLETAVRFGPALWSDRPFADWWAEWWVRQGTSSPAKTF